MSYSVENINNQTRESIYTEYLNSGDEFVYFILQNETNQRFCKIGKSNSEKGVWQRFLGMKVGNPKTMVLLGYLENTQEEYWHRVFEDRLRVGEWFYCGTMLPILYNLNLKIPESALNSFKSDIIRQLHNKVCDAQEEYDKLTSRPFKKEAKENLNNYKHEYKIREKELNDKSKLIEEYREYAFSIPNENKAVNEFGMRTGVDLYDVFGWERATYGNYEYSIKEEYKRASELSDKILKVLNSGVFFNNLIIPGWQEFRYSTLAKTTLDECDFPIMKGETCFVCGEGWERYRLSYLSAYRYYYKNLNKRTKSIIFKNAEEDELKKRKEEQVLLEKMKPIWTPPKT